MLKEYSTEKVIAQLFDNQPDAVIWLLPLFSDTSSNEQIIDFETQYANQAAIRMLGSSSSAIVGTRLLANQRVDSTSTKIIFSQCCEVWKSGIPLEYTYYNPGLDRYFNVQRTKVEGGILSITRDRTSEVKADTGKQNKERIYREILDSTADGIMLLKAIRGNDNEVTDFVIWHCNRQGLEIGRFSKDTIGKSILTVLPHLKNSVQFRLHKQVVNTGQPVRFETSFRTPAGDEYGWFIVSLTKLDDCVISSFVDVTDKKLDEQKILEQKQLLNNILDASLSAVYTCEAVRNDKGEIIDFRFIQVNQKFKELSVRPGFDVIGKRLLEEFPATAQTNTLEKLVQVVKTGKPQRFEVHYQSDTDNGWYDTSAVKMGDDGVVVTFINVTQQKKASLEIEQQRDLLQKLLRHYYPLH